MNKTLQIHGSIPYAELRTLNIPASFIIDFSATVNPFPLPESIRNLFTPEGIGAYPDSDCYEAREAVAQFYNILVEWVVVSAGVTEVIFSLPLLFRRAVCFSPTYGDYTAAYKRHRRNIFQISFDDLDSGWGKIVEKIRDIQSDLIIICNPNNPTGHYLSLWQIEELCGTFCHTIICIDESYQEMGEKCDTSIHMAKQFHNLLVLKSFTKPFGLGGLRAGYAVSSGEVIKRIKMNLIPWGVSSIAQRIIPYLFSNYSYFQHQWAAIVAERNKLIQCFSGQNLPVVSGRCPFFLVKIGNAEYIRKRLLTEYHTAIRSCVSFEMPEWIRIMPGRPEMNIKLLENIKSILDD